MAKEKKEVTSLHEYIIESAAKKGKTPADWFDAMVMHMNVIWPVMSENLRIRTSRPPYAAIRKKWQAM